MNALDLLYVPVAIATSPMWAFKKRDGWSERFGRTPRLPPRRAGAAGRLLLHAVSVGEVSALRHLVPLLTPTLDVVVSATTDTGLKRARELFAPACHVVRYPLDFSDAVDRFLDAVRPDAVALVELELWPNFLRACRERRVPACVINGRLSPRSFRGYRRIRRFVAPMFRTLEFAAVQDADYAARFEFLGVPRDRVRIAGSMKWDAAKIEDSVAGAEELAREMGIDRQVPLVVAGSTGPGEEALLHRAVPADVQLLCAPRKPERFDEAAAAMPGCVRRSNPQLVHSPGAKPTRFVLDTIGELRAAYSLADVVVIGRSFFNLFGSDPIDPISLGKPTVIGPSVADFAQIVAAFEDGGGIVRSSAEELPGTILGLLADAEVRSRLGERGRLVIRAQAGGSGRCAAMLQELIAKSGIVSAPVSGGVGG